MVYVSATPGERELRHLCEITGQSVPNGLLHSPSGGGAGEADLAKKHPEAESMYDMLQSIQGIAKMELGQRAFWTRDRSSSNGRQVNDLLTEINARIERKERCLVWS